LKIDEALKEFRHVHFIGIGGAGMFPLAEILHSRGYAVTGSDNNESDTLARVRALGIPVFLGHAPENLRGAEMVVQTAALLPDNIELVAAKEKGIPVFERAKLLGALSGEFSRSIGIAGTHGKTTVTSMVVQILVMAGKDPTAVIGGKLPLLNSNAAVGKTDLFVCEACEFAGTFLEMHPSCSVILNIDADHLDYFKTMQNLMRAFATFAALAGDTVIYNGDDANTLQALSGLWEKEEGAKKRVTFGLGEGNDWRGVNIGLHDGAFPCFDVVQNNALTGHVRLAVPGEHNVYNALAAIAAATYAGASFEDCARGLESFRGAGRRFEILKEIDGITIADDYAHHPAELKVTLEAAKKMNYDRVIAVFQPFTYSRTYTLMDDFAAVLQIADVVVMSEIMGAREVNTFGVYTAQLAEKIPGSVWFETFDEIAGHVARIAKKGDLVITLGCGDIYKAAKKLIGLLSKAEEPVTC
jgi:UDP-N-acetylmuramate--alanine ligase